jgi:hypothetical protein
VQGPGVIEGGMIVTVGSVGQLLAAVSADAASARAPKGDEGSWVGSKCLCSAHTADGCRRVDCSVDSFNSHL